MSSINPRMFGELAVGQELITEEQLEAAMREQFDSGLPLGDILLEQEALEAGQVDQLRQRVAAELDTDDSWFGVKMAEAELGRLVCFRDLITSEQLDAAIRAQALVDAEGAEQSIGEVMVGIGLLTEHQLVSSLTYQVMFCTQCMVLYKVRGFERGYKVKCVTCPVLLAPPPASLDSFTDTMDLFIDSKAVREREVLGQLAINRGYCSKPQIGHAQERFVKELGTTPFGDILVDESYLTNKQLGELTALADRQADSVLDRRRAMLKGVKFGEIGVRLGMFNSEMLLKALRQQMGEETSGGRPLLGLLLLREGCLTRSQGLRILDLQNKVVVWCPKCKERYNVQFGVSRRLPDCPECERTLAALEGEADSLEVARDLTPAPSA